MILAFTNKKLSYRCDEPRVPGNGVIATLTYLHTAKWSNGMRRHRTCVNRYLMHVSWHAVKLELTYNVRACSGEGKLPLMK